MARCTAPVYGHRTSSARANCPACGRGYSGYSSYSPRSMSYSSTSSSRNFRPNNNSGKTKARWASSGSTILYTPAEIKALTPVRDNVVKRSSLPDLRDVFLCHAWDDRKDSAKELHDSLESKGVSVWFSEKDVLLGSSLLREIDKGLSKSRVGIVLVTPSFLARVKGAGIADKELSALLFRDQLVPIVHNTTFDALREVSPLLGSRAGLNMEEDTMEGVADKLAELLAPASMAI